jgi:hypothetical protein
VDITWIAIISSIVMGVSAAIIVLFFMKHESLRPSHDVETRALWAELEKLSGSSPAGGRRR